MKFENVFSSNLSFLFLTGYLCISAWLMLLLSSVTPLYREVMEIAKTMPVSTVLLAAPFAVIVGILFDAVRRVINKYLLRRKVYDFAYLSAETKQVLGAALQRELSGQDMEDVLDEKSYALVKAGWMPEFDEHSLKSRWIHDFLDAAIYVGVISIGVLSIRMAMNPLRGLDYFMFVVMVVVIFFATLSLSDLKVAYTRSEVAMMLRGTQSSNDEKS